MLRHEQIQFYRREHVAASRGARRHVFLTFPGTEVMDARASLLRYVLYSALMFSPNVVAAGDPTVAFDFGRTAECVDVTEEVAAGLFEHERIIELRLRVSVHLLSGDEKRLEEVRIEIGDFDQKLRVHNFAPNTTLESRHTQSIRRTRTTEKEKGFEASLGGQLPVPVGNVVANVTPTVGGAVSNRDLVTETEHRVPPKHTVVASGTINAEHGVFFKLRNSPLSTLEGTHDLVVQFVVPNNWRADSMRVCCEATGQDKVLWIEQETTWARKCAPVAVYRAGDLKARQAAEKFAARR